MQEVPARTNPDSLVDPRKTVINQIDWRHSDRSRSSGEGRNLARSLTACTRRHYPSAAVIIPTCPAAGRVHHLRRPRRYRQEPQLHKLAAALRHSGHKVVETREPGGDRHRRKNPQSPPRLRHLRPVALRRDGAMSRLPRALAEVIEPALAAGSIRAVTASPIPPRLYQGYAHKLGSDPVPANSTVCSAETSARPHPAFARLRPGR